jgi:hypothetical protein
VSHPGRQRAFPIGRVRRGQTRGEHLGEGRRQHGVLDDEAAVDVGAVAQIDEPGNAGTGTLLVERGVVEGADRCTSSAMRWSR